MYIEKKVITTEFSFLHGFMIIYIWANMMLQRLSGKHLSRVFVLVDRCPGKSGVRMDTFPGRHVSR